MCVFVKCFYTEGLKDENSKFPENLMVKSVQPTIKIQ